MFNSEIEMGLLDRSGETISVIDSITGHGSGQVDLRYIEEKHTGKKLSCRDGVMDR